VDLTELLGKSELKIFQQAVKNGGVIKALKISGGNFTRSHFDDLTKFAQEAGAKGLAWLKVTDTGFESPIAKFLTKEQKEINELLEAKTGDTIFIVADAWKTTCNVLGVLRLKLARELNLIDAAQLKIAWVVDFPLFDWNEDEKRLDPNHHPFTSPREEDVPLLDKEPAKAKARAYDLVLNGTEVGGGSVRIHQETVQKKIFEALKIGDQEAEEKFGFLLRALRFGAPPHAGIAIGFDRLTALLLGLDSIRDVIAFPKTQKGTCLMTDAPGQVYPKQLKELHLKLT